MSSTRPGPRSPDARSAELPLRGPSILPRETAARAHAAAGLEAPAPGADPAFWEVPATRCRVCGNTGEHRMDCTSGDRMRAAEAPSAVAEARGLVAAWPAAGRGHGSVPALLAALADENDALRAEVARDCAVKVLLGAASEESAGLRERAERAERCDRAERDHSDVLRAECSRLSVALDGAERARDASLARVAVLEHAIRFWEDQPARGQALDAGERALLAALDGAAPAREAR